MVEAAAIVLVALIGLGAVLQGRSWWVRTRARARLEGLGTPIGPLDTLIAGTALAHRAVLVSRNIREFGRVAGLEVVDWYT